MAVRKAATPPADEPAYLTLLSGPILKKLRVKFSDEGAERVAIALEEVVRYLQLSAASPASIFFPGDRLMDDLWHALIVETAEYRELCDKLRPGCFIDHSGILFDDYLARKTVPEIHEEQVSWLVSYVGNFGPISEKAFAHLTLARSLCERMGIDLEKLNALAQSLLVRADAGSRKRISLDDHLKRVSGTAASRVARDPAALREALLGIVGTVSLPLKNAQLEKVFAASTALGFTLWQHLAAMERLTLAESWRAENPDLWEDLKQGKELVGLATTHLASVDNVHVRAEPRTNGSFALTGTLPWVTGRGIFRRLIVGFRNSEEFIFALMDFPSVKVADEARIETVDLGCLEGTATVKIHLDQWIVLAEHIIGRRPIKSPPAKSRSAYVFPDLGIAGAALAECEGQITARGGLSPQDLEAKLLPTRRLEARVNALRASTETGDTTDEDVFRKDECIRDAVRLLALTTGGRSLVKGSVAFRLQQELLLLDAVIQPVATRALKIDKASRG